MFFLSTRRSLGHVLPKQSEPVPPEFVPCHPHQVHRLDLSKFAVGTTKAGGKLLKCKYQHACSWCRAPHPFMDCQQRATQGRSRSAFRTHPLSRPLARRLLPTLSANELHKGCITDCLLLIAYYYLNCYHLIAYHYLNHPCYQTRRLS